MRKTDEKNQKKKLTPAVKVGLFAGSCVLTLGLCAIITAGFSSVSAASQNNQDGSEPFVDLRIREAERGETLAVYVPEEKGDVDDDGERMLPYDDGDDIAEEVVDGPVNLIVNVDGHSYSLLTHAATVEKALQEQKITVGASDYIKGADLDSEPEDGMRISVIRVERDTRTEVETIPYETLYVWKEEMMEGEYYTINEGRNGKITRTYTLVYENGVLTSETLSDVKKEDKVDKRIAYGSRSSFSNSRGERIDYTKKIVCYATCYIPDAKWGYQTYVGERARPGVIAVDPSVIPLGTKVYIESPYPDVGDYGYAIAWDIGGHVKGNWVDLFVEYLDVVYQWGARDANVYILEDQSVDIFALRSDYFVFMDR